MDDYTKGMLDGEKVAIGNDAWILNGFILPGFAAIHARIHKPTPPKYVQQFLLGKSQDYIKGFTETYQSKSRIENANKALIGSGLFFCIGTLVAVVLLGMMYPNT